MGDGFHKRLGVCEYSDRLASTGAPGTRARSEAQKDEIYTKSNEYYNTLNVQRRHFNLTALEWPAIDAYDTPLVGTDREYPPVYVGDFYDGARTVIMPYDPGERH